MADIVELITKLGFEVNDVDQVKNVSNEFVKQANAIDKLQGKLDELKAKMKTTADVNEQQRLSNAILKTQKAIEAQTQAASKQLAASTSFQKAVVAEIGIIQRLNDKLSDLKRARDSQTTVEGINDINKALRETAQELQNLTNIEGASGSGGGGGIGGIIGNLFGVGSGAGAGKQILQGALAGLGIGVGFSIIPALVSSVLEYSSALIDVVGQTEKVLGANAALLSSFSKISDELKEISITELNAIYDSALPKDLAARNALLGQTEQGLQDTIDRLKAIGAVNGEVYDAEKAQLEVSNNLKREKVRLLEKELSILNDVIGITGDAANQANSAIMGDASVINTLKTIFSTTNSASKEEQRDAAQRVISASGLPQRIQQELTVDLKKAAEDGANIADVLDNVVKRYKSDRFKLTQQITSTIESENNATVEFNNKLIESARQLENTIRKELLASEANFQTTRLSIQEETEDNIREVSRINRGRQINDINKELADLRKIYELDGNGRIKVQEVIQKDGTKRIIDLEKDKALQIEQVTKLSLLNENEIIRQARLRRLREQEQIDTLLLQNELKTVTQNLDLLTSNEISSRVELRNAVTDAELAAQQAALSKQRDAQTEGLYKGLRELDAAGKQETQEYKIKFDNITNIEQSFIKAQDELQQKANVNRIRNIQIGFADAIKVIERETSDLQAAINRSFSGEQLGISEGGGGLFGRNFQQRLSQLDQSTVTELNNVQQTSKALINARKQLEDATKAEKSAQTPEDKKAAQEAIRDAETNINTLETKQNVSNKRIVDNEREALKLKVNAYTDAYMQIAQVAQNAYNQIAEYRQQDIQREISAREKQLSVGIELAKLGNTQLLDEQRNALKQAREEQRQAALEQQAINSALQLSYALVAVAKAAAEGGGIGSIATVAAAIGALVAGYGLVRTASQSTQTPAFKDGVIDFQGQGTATSDSNVVRISRGESVMTAKATERFKDQLKLMQSGIDPRQSVSVNSIGSGGVSRGEFMELRKGFDSVVDAINGKQMSVETITTRDHIATMVKEQKRMDRRKYGQVN
jgi:hypothetical protein